MTVQTRRITEFVERVFRGARAAEPPPPPAPPPQSGLADAVSHLRYLGYEVGEPEADGWRFAQHPSRYNFHLIAGPLGFRLHSGASISRSNAPSRAAWLEHLNSASEAARITQFSLVEPEPGSIAIRMRATITGAYDLKIFAVMMDLWHDDLDLIRRRAPASEVVVEAGATVH